jgi:hypothetical protein
MSTVYELLQCANVNLQVNGDIGVVVAREQLQEALDWIDGGKGLDDECDGDES